MESAACRGGSVCGNSLLRVSIPLRGFLGRISADRTLLVQSRTDLYAIGQVLGEQMGLAEWPGFSLPPGALRRLHQVAQCMVGSVISMLRFPVVASAILRAGQASRADQAV